MTRDEAKAELLVVVTECVPAEHLPRVSKAVAAYVAACVRQELASRQLTKNVADIFSRLKEMAEKEPTALDGAR